MCLNSFSVDLPFGSSIKYFTPRVIWGLNKHDETLHLSIGVNVTKKWWLNVCQAVVIRWI